MNLCAGLKGSRAEMKNKTCFIVGAGEFDGMRLMPESGDLIIAADGGYMYLKDMGLEPDVLMGDFDSLELIPEHQHLLKHSPIKDDTDMALAVAYAADQGYQRFLLYGGLGGRLDHTLANIQLLNGMSRSGLEAYLIGQGTIMTAITGEEIWFSAGAQGMISVFCLGDAASGVWESGLKYGLQNAVMTCDKTIGVSNEFCGCRSSISVADGTLILVWEEANGLPEKRACQKRAMGQPRNDIGDARNLISESGWKAMNGRTALEIESSTYNGNQEQGVHVE